jgi:hypothetical protein
MLYGSILIFSFIFFNKIYFLLKPIAIELKWVSLSIESLKFSFSGDKEGNAREF